MISTRQVIRPTDPGSPIATMPYTAVPMARPSRACTGPARLGRERSGLLGHLTGVDTQAIWEWGFVQRVSTGLLAMQVGAEVVRRGMLVVAVHWVQP
jgi:hypothetical protein